MKTTKQLFLCIVFFVAAQITYAQQISKEDMMMLTPNVKASASVMAAQKSPTISSNA